MHIERSRLVNILINFKSFHHRKDAPYRLRPRLIASSTFSRLGDKR